MSDLDRALAFYENTFPVQRLAHINGPAQSYPGFGIEQGQFEGWVLENKKDVSPPGDLIAEFPARLLHPDRMEITAPDGANRTAKRIMWAFTDRIHWLAISMLPMPTS